MWKKIQQLFSMKTLWITIDLWNNCVAFSELNNWNFPQLRKHCWFTLSHCAFPIAHHTIKKETRIYILTISFADCEMCTWVSSTWTNKINITLIFGMWHETHRWNATQNRREVKRKKEKKKHRQIRITLSISFSIWRSNTGRNFTNKLTTSNT